MERNRFDRIVFLSPDESVFSFVSDMDKELGRFLPYLAVPDYFNPTYLYSVGREIRGVLQMSATDRLLSACIFLAV